MPFGRVPIFPVRLLAISFALFPYFGDTTYRLRATTISALLRSLSSLTTDLHRGHCRGHLLDFVVWNLCDDVMAWGPQCPFMAKLYLLGLWVGSRLGAPDHHGVSVGQWRSPGQAFLALLCLFRRGTVPSPLCPLGTGHPLWCLPGAC